MVIIVLCQGCAKDVSFIQAGGMEPVGFWSGLWHGLIFPFSFIGSSIFDSVAVYAIYNNGGPYDLGFFLGIFCLIASLFMD